MMFYLSLLFSVPQLHANTTELTYCIDPDWMPYEAIQEGQHVGISADYLNLIAEKSGFSFRLIPSRSWLQTLQMLQNGSCMLSPMLNKSAERDTYLRFTEVYFRAPNVLISTQAKPFLLTLDTLDTQRLAVPAGYRLMEYLAEHYPDINTILVGSENAALQAVLNHSADVAIGSLYAFNYHIQAQARSQLKITGWINQEDQLRLGVGLAYQAILPQLDQALAAITETEHLAIYRKWTRSNMTEKSNRLWIWLCAGLSLVMALLVGWRYKQRS